MRMIAVKQAAAGIGAAAVMALGGLTAGSLFQPVTSPSSTGPVGVAVADPDACAGIGPDDHLGTAACDQQRKEEAHQWLQDAIDRQREKPSGGSAYCELFPDEAKCQPHTGSGVPAWLIVVGVLLGLPVLGFMGLVVAGGLAVKRDAAASDDDGDWDDDDDEDDEDDDGDDFDGGVVDYPESSSAPPAPTGQPSLMDGLVAQLNDEEGRR